MPLARDGVLTSGRGRLHRRHLTRPDPPSKKGVRRACDASVRAWPTFARERPCPCSCVAPVFDPRVLGRSVRSTPSWGFRPHRACVACHPPPDVAEACRRCVTVLQHALGVGAPVSALSAAGRVALSVDEKWPFKRVQGRFSVKDVIVMDLAALTVMDQECDRSVTEPIAQVTVRRAEDHGGIEDDRPRGVRQPAARAVDPGQRGQRVVACTARFPS